MPTAEDVEDNMSQRRMEKSEGVWIVGNGVELEEEEEEEQEGTDRRGSRSKYWAHEERNGEEREGTSRRGGPIQVLGT